MPSVRVVQSRLGADREVDAPEGGQLADLADHARLPIPFSCRSAGCATCHVVVLEGAELLHPAEDDEQDLLDIIDGPEGSRLACQVVLRRGPGLVRLRPV